MVEEKKNMKRSANRSQSSKKIKTLDLVLIIVGLYALSFVVATVIIYTINGWQYDALFPYALCISGVEGICSMIITVSKYKHKIDISEEEEDGMD